MMMLDPADRICGGGGLKGYAEGGGFGLDVAMPIKLRLSTNHAHRTLKMTIECSRCFESN